FITSLISVFGPQPRPCRSQAQFLPGALREYRFQGTNDQSGVPFPANPEFTYVGPLPNGSLGTRTPERRLAGTFGQAPSTSQPPIFSTAPLTEPVTLGGEAELRTFIQGPSDAVAGRLGASILDIDDKGVPAVIGDAPPKEGAKASTAAPEETKVKIPLGGPH